MIAGNFTAGPVGQAVTLDQDKKYAVDIVLPTDAWLGKLTCFLDGQGAGVGDQRLKAIVYATGAGGALKGAGSEVLVADGAAGAWVDLPFAAPLFLPAGTYQMGMHAGLADKTVRGYGVTGTGTRVASDTYADGQAATFGTTSSANTLPIFASFFPAWTPDDALSDEYLATLGFQTAQAALGDTAGPVGGSALSGACGWHGTLLDPHVGPYAVVRSDGPFADRVGERVRVSLPVKHRSVVCYVVSEADIEEDISLARRAFLSLAPPSEDELTVTVETLA